MPINSQNVEVNKSTITPMQFDMAANTHLQGTALLVGLNSINLETDEIGNIKEHVLNNLKMILSKVADATKDEIARSKFQKMSKFLEQY